MDDYKLVIDTREKNKDMIALAGNDAVKTRLKLSRFVLLPPGQPDLDCGDLTNENADGIVEFKSFADFVGSTTGDGVHHLEEQVIKMYSTGFPFAVIVHGSRWVFKKQADVKDGLITNALQKLMSLVSIYKFAAIFVEDEPEAMELAKTFLRKCTDLPRSMPVYSLLKHVHAGVSMLVGIHGIGEKKARAIMSVHESMKDFVDKMSLLKQLHGIPGCYEELAGLTPGIGKVDAERLFNAFSEIYK